MLQQHQPDRRHRGGERDAVVVEQFVDRGAVELGARHHHGGADIGEVKRQPPAIGVEHRHHRHHHVARADAHGVGLRRHHGMQHVGAVRIEHALGIAGGAGGVAHAGRGVLVERLPGEVAVGFGDPFLIGHGIFQRGRRHMRGVGQDHILLDRLKLVGELFQDRHESEIDHHDAIFGVIDDPADLVGEQPRIDGVIDGADAHDAVPGFEMPPCVPRQRRHPVAELDAGLVEPLRNAQRALRRLA